MQETRGLADLCYIGSKVKKKNALVQLNQNQFKINLYHQLHFLFLFL